MVTFDLVVIGGGPGGYPAAIRAAQLGASVAMVEREELGGTCLNWGCIPTKLFIDAAKLCHSVRKAEFMGISAGGLTIDFQTLAAHKDKTVARMRSAIGSLLKANGVKVFQGTAAFQGPDQIVVATPGTETSELGAGRIILATGSTSIMPAAFPVNERILESRAFLALRQLPKSLLVVGGGYIGCELACMAAQLGVQVTLVELLADILPGLDADVRKEVRRAMESQLGIRILTGHPLREVQPAANEVSALCGDQKIQAELLLVAVGRKPVTHGLAMEKAGIQPDARGFIQVNEFGQTEVPNIYAIGDVNGRAQLAHAATSQGLVAASHALGNASEANELVVPGVIFTSPEVGVVGLSETEAQGRGIPVKVGRFPFAGLGRSIAAGNTVGMAKWIACATTDRLLGAAVVGPSATELIAEAAVAIRGQLKVREVANTIHAHPTFSEIWSEAGHAVHGEAIHAAPMKKNIARALVSGQ